jgi:hypothetical protein
VSDDLLLVLAVMAVGFLVLFAGIPEGLIRAASLVLAALRSPKRSRQLQAQRTAAPGVHRTDVDAGHDIISRQLEASAMIEKSATPNDSSPHWFYEDKDGYSGPTTAEAIQDLLRQGSISYDTLVWNKTFGQQA